VSVVGSEAGMDARRVDADSSGARDGVARLSVRPLRGVELPVERRTRLSYPSGRPATRRNVSVRPCQRCSCFFPGQHSSLAGRSPAIAP